MNSINDSGIEFQLNDDYTVKIRRFNGSNGEYYSINGTNYDIHFPIEWVFQLPNKENSHSDSDHYFGPEECNLCAEYGYYNGVFIGYCLRCAKHADFKRGNGMIRSGDEITFTEANQLGIPIVYDDENSMWNVYMQTVTLDQIGDVELAKKHANCFQIKHIINGYEIQEKFDFYKWLNMCDINPFISDEDEEEYIPDLHSVESVIDDSMDSECESEPIYPANLSLVLPEPEPEPEPELKLKYE